MTNVDVNYLAILVSGVVSMALGYFWYSKSLFGDVWIRESGVSMEKSQKGMLKQFSMQFVASLITAYVLSNILASTGSQSVGDGISGGFWIWLGFIFPFALASVLYEKKSWTYFWITTGYYLVYLLLAGIILSVWI